MRQEYDLVLAVVRLKDPVSEIERGNWMLSQICSGGPAPLMAGTKSEVAVRILEELWQR